MRSAQVYLALAAAACLLLVAPPAHAVDGTVGGTTPQTERGDRMLTEYFAHETAKLAERSLADIKTLDDWKARREELMQQLREMLSLDPWPEKTPLNAVITGKVEHEEFTVENLHFQSRPGLYVTANLYVPKGLEGPVPAVLYVCGHGRVKIDGVSYGNKTHYQHHGAWLARHGYVCLIIDTLQLGEIEGIHHGTHREGMWWWNCRGYTSAGVEAWNCIRALDYLETRSEVDAEKMGVTGRSGGGAYSWWIAALDERIKAAVPVAGIVDLESHVVDGCVEGHCDCMFMLNTYRWDYPMVATMVAPRALLLTNTDKDGIFPLEGVIRTHRQVREIYRLYDADKNFALQISEGPHKDTPELQVAAFRWLNLHLKGDDGPVEMPAEKLFTPQELKVFQGDLPADEQNTTIQETFTVVAPRPEVPADSEAWRQQRDAWMQALKEKCFRGWPDDAGELDMREVSSGTKDGVRLTVYEYQSQPHVRLPLYVLSSAEEQEPAEVTLRVVDEAEWQIILKAVRGAFEEQLGNERLDETVEEGFLDFEDIAAGLSGGKPAVAVVPPRGIGPTQWDQTEREHTHIERRFMLLGQTADTMRVWDVRRALQTVRSIEAYSDASLQIVGNGPMAGVALYASLFEPNVAQLQIGSLPMSHREGPYFFNVQRVLDMPQAVAMAAERSKVMLRTKAPEAWQYAVEVAKNLGWSDGARGVTIVEGD